MSVLTRLRESLGFERAEVAAAAGWPRERQREIERDPANQVDEVEAVILSDLFGMDVVEIIERDRLPSRRTAVAGLLKARADVLDAESRFSLAEAVTVAREARELQQLLDLDTGWRKLTSFKDNPDYSHPREGTPATLASLVRRRMGVAPGPVDSVQRRFLDPLGILVISARIEDPEVDAFSFASARTGGVIVLNEASSWAGNAFFRRVALAHELCHLLFDRKQMLSIADFSTRRQRRRTDGLERLERRARAFAVELLAPESGLAETWCELESQPIHRRIRLVMEMYGIGYEATRGQLDNAGMLSLDTDVAGTVSSQAPAAWDERDPVPAAMDASLSSLRLQRRGALVDLLCRAWATGALSEAAVREGLRLNHAAWQETRAKLLPRLGDRMTRAWSTSSAVHG